MKNVVACGRCVAGRQPCVRLGGEGKMTFFLLAKADRDGTAARDHNHWVVGDDDESTELRDGHYMSPGEARMN